MQRTETNLEATIQAERRKNYLATVFDPANTDTVSSFEGHTTVNIPESAKESPESFQAWKDKFKSVCANIGATAVVLDLGQNRENLKQMSDAMTSVYVEGKTAFDALAQINLHELRLTAAGFEVVRQKIESCPYFKFLPADASASAHDFSLLNMPDTYFECHIPVLFKPEVERSLDLFAKNFLVHHTGITSGVVTPVRVHLSRNSMSTPDEMGRICKFINIRMTDIDLRGFSNAVQFLSNQLVYAGQLHGWDQRHTKNFIEYAFFDSRSDWDRDWLLAAA